jgi:hypothetical protein
VRRPRYQFSAEPGSKMLRVFPIAVSSKHRSRLCEKDQDSPVRFGSAKWVGADVQKLLKAGAAPFEIKYRPITGREFPQAARHLCSIVPRFSPQLTCLVFGSDSLDQMAELFAAVRERGETISIPH